MESVVFEILSLGEVSACFWPLNLKLLLTCRHFFSQVLDKFYYLWTNLAEIVFIIFYAGDEFD